MQLSSQCDDCWLCHILSAMNVSHNPTCSKKGCWRVSPLISVVLSRTSGRGTWIIGHLILVRIHQSATINAPLIIY